MTSHDRRGTHCTFCDLIHGAGEVSVCYEDADAIAFMDIQPVNLGHVLVVPRQHFESLFDVPRELGVHLFDVTMRLAGAVKKVTGCEGMNLVVNSGTVAGQDEMHYHVHIIPRRAGDGFDIPLPFNGSEMPDRTLLDAEAARIIAALRNPMPSAPRPAGGTRVGEAGRAQASERAAAPPSREAGARDAQARDAGAQAAPVERERAVSVAVEAPRAQSASRRDRDLASYEGAHGELVRADGSES